MQAPTAEWPGLARPFCCFLKENFLNTFLLHPFMERILKQARMRLFKDLLTRNLPPFLTAHDFCGLGRIPHQISLTFSAALVLNPGPDF